VSPNVAKLRRIRRSDGLATRSGYVSGTRSLWKYGFSGFSRQIGLASVNDDRVNN
jgi:hypothetical protein